MGRALLEKAIEENKHCNHDIASLTNAIKYEIFGL